MMAKALTFRIMPLNQSNNANSIPGFRETTKYLETQVAGVKPQICCIPESRLQSIL